MSNLLDHLHHLVWSSFVGEPKDRCHPTWEIGRGKMRWAAGGRWQENVSPGIPVLCSWLSFFPGRDFSLPSSPGPSMVPSHAAPQKLLSCLELGSHRLSLAAWR